MSGENRKFTLRLVVEKNRLNDANFLDWERQLRIVLMSEQQEDVLSTPIPVLTETSSDEEKDNHKKICERSRNVSCLTLAAIEPGLEQRFEYQDAYTTMKNLRDLFKEQARIERYELHGMLKTTEQTVLIAPKKDVLMVNKEKGFKKCPQKKQQYQGKGKKVVEPKVLEPKVRVVVEHECFHCKAKGNWKRNCQSIGKIRRRVLPYQGLQNRRRLQKGEINFRVGNGAAVAAIEIGDYSLPLSSGLVLKLVIVILFLQ